MNDRPSTLNNQNWIEISIAVLLVLLYAPSILHWVDGWLNKSISLEHEYFSHGLIGLPFAAWIVWEKWQKWQSLSPRYHPLGTGLIGLAGAFYLSGLWDLVNLSLPLILTGICLWFKGFPGLRLMWFPLLLVLLATPNDLPYLIASYTLPLQSFIAGTAGFILMLLGMNVTVDGIHLFVGGRVIEVAPHCSGIKMLFTTLYVALMLLYWRGVLSSRFQTIAFLVSAVFLSVAINIFRNTLLSLFYGKGLDAAFHWFHEGLGSNLIYVVISVLLIPILKFIETLSVNHE
jgi:cyanoexosortase B